MQGLYNNCTLVPTKIGDLFGVNGLCIQPGVCWDFMENLDRTPTPHPATRWWFEIFFYFHPYLGKRSNLTNIFQVGWNHQPERFRGISLLKIVTILVVMGGRSNGELFDLRTFPKQQPFTFLLGNVWPDANLASKQTKPCGGFSTGSFLPNKFFFGTDYALKINTCQRFRRTIFLLQEVLSHWQKYVTSCGPTADPAKARYRWDLWCAANSRWEWTEPPRVSCSIDFGERKVWHKSHRKGTKQTSRCWEVSLRACSLWSPCSIL